MMPIGERDGRIIDAIRFLLGAAPFDHIYLLLMAGGPRNREGAVVFVPCERDDWPGASAPPSVSGLFKAPAAGEMKRRLDLMADARN